MPSAPDVKTTKVVIAILIVLIVISLTSAPPVINFIALLICIPYLLYQIKLLLPHYLHRKCPRCRSIMGIEYDIIFDGAESTDHKTTYLPVAIKEETCPRCGTVHLSLFNPAGVRSSNVGGFNSLHRLADLEFVGIYQESISQGGRLPRVHYITPDAHKLLMKMFDDRVKKVNAGSRFMS